MSQSTLKDFYAGMKMTTFDGSNIYHQIRKMNEDPVGMSSMAAARNIETFGSSPALRANSNRTAGGFN